jgi:hypothetical protein
LAQNRYRLTPQPAGGGHAPFKNARLATINLKNENFFHTLLETVLGKAPAERARMLKDEAKCEVTAGALEQLKAVKSTDELLSALASGFHRE